MCLQEASDKYLCFLSGQARARGGGAEAAYSAVRLRPEVHLLHLQRQAELGHAEEVPQGHQGGARKDEGQGRGEASE